MGARPIIGSTTYVADYKSAFCDRNAPGEWVRHIRVVSKVDRIMVEGKWENRASTQRSTLVAKKHTWLADGVVG